MPQFTHIGAYGPGWTVRALGLVALVAALLSVAPATRADPLPVAVAANFTQTLERLVTQYRLQAPAFEVRLSSGSSGKHSAQIRQGAPFALFFSADDQRTAELVASGHAEADSRFIYALGRLVLWSPDPARVPEDGLALLRSGDFDHLAMANPRVAPYGAAAQALLQRAGVVLSPGQQVTGQSLGQAFNFVASGNAELGLLAMAQVLAYERRYPAGSRWTPPLDQYPAIRQEVVLLKEASASGAAREFLHWLRHDPRAHRILTDDGYALADADSGKQSQ